MKRMLNIVAASAVALAVGAALADPPAGRGPGAGFGPGAENCIGAGPGAGARGGPGGWGGMGMSQAGAEARLADLKAALKIAPAQEAAWNGYADVVKREALAREQFRSQMAATPAEARADVRDGHFAHNREAAKELSAAREGLYAVLTAEQKTVADRYLFGHMGRGGGWRHG